MRIFEESLHLLCLFFSLNTYYADIVVDELQVQGVVIGAYHKFE